QSTELVCRPQPVSVWNDPLKLKQVLVNLVTNALKYSGRGGQVVVAVRYSCPTESLGFGARRRAEIVVSDTGPGIDPEFRERVFEQGFRLGRDAHLQGKGLGLAIVRDVVTQHSGTVHIDGQAGQGAAFVVSLPCDLRVRKGEKSDEA